MSQSTSTYVYQHLPEGHIRLLTFHSSGHGSYTGSLHPARPKRGLLSRRLKYFALSYTWGEDTQTYPFNCDGHNLPVRANLLAALQCLAGVVKETPVWIDAMCINQTDEKEKFGQLRMMPLIYSSAEQVMIWLGPKTDATDYAIRQIPDITARFKRARPKKNENMASLPMPDADCVRGIGDLLTRPWWSRLWVLQEAGLARSAVFLCGSSSVEWSVLRDLASEIRRLNLAHRFRPTPRLSLDSCDGFNELLNVELVKHRHDISFPSNILRDCRQRDCFDPRDRVNAIVGLIPPHMREGYVWEPGADIAGLYSSFAALMAQFDIFGVLLSMVETSERRGDLPSWVPDFHQRGAAEILADYDGYHAGYNVHSGAVVKVNGENPRQIELPSIPVDQVSTVCDGTWEDLSRLESSTDLASVATRNVQWLNVCTQALEIISSHEPGRQPVPRPELWRVLIGDQVADVNNSRLRHLSGFGKLHDSIVEWRSSNKEEVTKNAYDNLIATIQDFAAGADSRLPSPGSAEYQNLQPMASVCAHRKLFLTLTGRVGLGPLDIRDGDMVVICKGFKVPFVLRPVVKTYSTTSNSVATNLEMAYNMLGEAYVHGVMKGECLSGSPPPGFQDMLVV